MFLSKRLRQAACRVGSGMVAGGTWHRRLTQKHRRMKEKPCRPGNRTMVKSRKCTYRYIQLLVSRLGLPVSHSGANVIQPSGAVNHVSASYSQQRSVVSSQQSLGPGPHLVSPMVMTATSFTCLRVYQNKVDVCCDSPPYISPVARTIIQKYFFNTPFFSSLDRR